MSVSGLIFLFIRTKRYQFQNTERLEPVELLTMLRRSRQRRRK
jgi:hypothetical protein